MGGMSALAAELLGEAPLRAEPLSGGDLSSVVRLHLPSGRTVIAKSGPQPKTEAAMLCALSRAGVPSPGIFAAGGRALLLEDLPERGSLSELGWAELGRALKTLHAAVGPAYGWDGDYAFRHVPIENAWLNDWPAFWALRRLLPGAGALPPAMAREVQDLCHNIHDLLPSFPPASLLHGDLWSGNIIACDGRLSGLIDPACYYGHGEVDLAMLGLFGRPDPAFWSSYGDPGPGWAIRQAIYQLWPAITHVRLFGDSYLPMVRDLLARVPVRRAD